MAALRAGSERREEGTWDLMKRFGWGLGLGLGFDGRERVVVVVVVAAAEEVSKKSKRGLVGDDYL